MEIKILLLYPVFCVIPQCLNFMWWHFGNDRSIFIGGTRRKYNRDEIVGVFIQERFGSKIAWANRKVGDKGRGVRVEKQAMEGKGPKWRPTIYPSYSSCLQCLWGWNRKRVPKCQYIKFRRWGIAQKKEKTIFRTWQKFEIKEKSFATSDNMKDQHRKCKRLKPGGGEVYIHQVVTAKAT